LSIIEAKIEIRAYPKRCYPYALLYLTGSANFNESIRLEAERSGYTLNDTSLKKLDGSGEVKCETEEEIFKALGMNYKLPEERDINVVFSDVI
jgi:DNA polymerase/3'-5' exonuclease PolX